VNLLIADIGATWARFASATGERIQRQEIVPLADFESVEALVEHAVSELKLTQVDAACLAVAGPSVRGRIAVVNGSLEFDAESLSTQLECEALLVNDFFALAHAVPGLVLGEHLQQLGGEPPDPAGVKAVLGPGTGLGMSMLLPEEGGRWRVLASEGGHADLAPGSPLELELSGRLHQRFDHVCWETVLSGQGLVNLYQSVAELWGVPAQDLDAADISTAGMEVADPMCHQTLELFCGFLGAAAGNLAVTAYARGGVYLGGGIVPRISGFLRESPFRRRFEERGVLTEFVRAIPVYLILDEQPGLAGAWRYLLKQMP